MKYFMISPDAPGQFKGDEFYGYPGTSTTASHVWDGERWSETGREPLRPWAIRDFNYSLKTRELTILWENGSTTVHPLIVAEVA